MGKYMRKSKATGEVAVMEVSHAQSSLGVRTRAKTLALQRLQKSAAAVELEGGGSGDGGGDGSSYLELRSRRLEKPFFAEAKRQRLLPKEANSHKSANAAAGVKGGSRKAKAGPTTKKEAAAAEEEDDNEVEQPPKRQRKDEVISPEEKNEEAVEKKAEEKLEQNDNVVVGDDDELQGSFGENMLDSECKDRTTREGTPCSLIRDPDLIRTPGSSNRPTTENEAYNIRRQNSELRHIPTTREMNEFFSGAEQQQQKQFVEKYNFDPVNEKPLPGRFEWTKIKP